jgi:hypothetical protein
MGYDLHITRKANWFDASPSIALDEWLEYVASDPEIQHDGFPKLPPPTGMFYGWNRRAYACGKDTPAAKIGKTPHGFGGAEATSLSKTPIKKSVGKCGLSPNLSKPKSREKRENIITMMAR